MDRPVEDVVIETIEVENDERLAISGDITGIQPYGAFVERIWYYRMDSYRD